MDFLDPKIERRNQILLLIGYGLVALAIAIATIILVYLSYGYGVDRQGNVIQKGLLFISSQPSGATITLNGQPYKSATNTRADIDAGTYTLKLTDAGYRPWQRQVVVAGSDVQHFDYPFLFPSQLKTAPLGDLSANPTLATQSPDKRWLIMDDPTTPGTFIEYDMKSPDKPVQTSFVLPAGSFTAGDNAGSWTLVNWASDNKHILLQHTYTTGGGAATEYVLVDRDDPASSVNLTNSLNLNATTTLDLFNQKTDQFWAYDQSAKTLSRLNGADGSVVSKLEGVLAYKPYGDSQLLYVTSKAPTGKDQAGLVTAVLQDGQKTISLRTLPDNAAYVLNLAQYGGSWYVGVGANTDSAAYIYKDPQSEAIVPGDTYPAPWRRLPVNHPTYLSFSSNTQFLLAESGQEFVVYDFENLVQYHYTAHEPIDQPQSHATWMDGDRLTYISGGKLLVFDYDYRNRQSLEPAAAAYLPFFASNYQYVYTLTASTDAAKAAVTTTPLTVTK